MTVVSEGKRVAIVQSNYIPWKGYFDLIASVDEFVLYDDVQYTRRDWRNRNQIKTANGLAWLTIPVVVSGRYHQRINEVLVDDPGWADRHWQTIVHQYTAAAAAPEYLGKLETLYREAPRRQLTEINQYFLTGVCALLGIGTRFRPSSDLSLTGDRTERLLNVCRQVGAAVYLSGPAARGYLDERLFNEAGIAVEWADYSGYPEYRQLHPPFRHEVSIVDLLLNEGGQAPRFMKHVRPVVA
jgi:hypothetical protein